MKNINDLQAENKKLKQELSCLKQTIKIYFGNVDNLINLEWDWFKDLFELAIEYKYDDEEKLHEWCELEIPELITSDFDSEEHWQTYHIAMEKYYPTIKDKLMLIRKMGLLGDKNE